MQAVSHVFPSGTLLSCCRSIYGREGVEESLLRCYSSEANLKLSTTLLFSLAISELSFIGIHYPRSLRPSLFHIGKKWCYTHNLPCACAQYAKSISLALVQRLHFLRPNVAATFPLRSRRHVALVHPLHLLHRELPLEDGPRLPPLSHLGVGRRQKSAPDLLEARPGAAALAEIRTLAKDSKESDWMLSSHVWAFPLKAKNRPAISSEVSSLVYDDTQNNGALILRDRARANQSSRRWTKMVIQSFREFRPWSSREMSRASGNVIMFQYLTHIDRQGTQWRIFKHMKHIPLRFSQPQWVSEKAISTLSQQDYHAIRWGGKCGECIQFWVSRSLWLAKDSALKVSGTTGPSIACWPGDSDGIDRAIRLLKWDAQVYLGLVWD